MLVAASGHPSCHDHGGSQRRRARSFSGVDNEGVPDVGGCGHLRGLVVASSSSKLCLDKRPNLPIGSQSSVKSMQLGGYFCAISRLLLILPGWHRRSLRGPDGPLLSRVRVPCAMRLCELFRIYCHD